MQLPGGQHNTTPQLAAARKCCVPLTGSARYMTSVLAAACSWNHETAAARQEVARTHKALKDIQGNIDKVQSSVAAEDAALKAAAEAAQLEQQLEQQVQELLRGLQQRQELLDHELQDRQREEQRVEVSWSAARKLPAVAFAPAQTRALPTPVGAKHIALSQHVSGNQQLFYPCCCRLLTLPVLTNCSSGQPSVQPWQPSRLQSCHS